MALQAGRVGVDPSQVDRRGNVKQSVDPYVLPVATSTVLGGVKPVEKTSDMTGEVGVDSNGKLYFEPPASGMKIYKKRYQLGTQQTTQWVRSDNVYLEGYTIIGATIVSNYSGYYGVGSPYISWESHDEIYIYATGSVAVVQGSAIHASADVFYVKNSDIETLT